MRGGRRPGGQRGGERAPHGPGTGRTWEHPYSRDEAAFPLAWIGEAKFFPYVSKIDNGYGDRNLCCRNCE